MDAVSHLALFYFFGRAFKVKKIWSGMVASMIPDSLLMINGICAAMGLNASLGSDHPLNLFLHSIFPLFLLSALLLLEKWYFYSAVVGYSSHLLLDYITHAVIRMPFYPVLDWKIPVFSISYLEPTFLLITGVVICALFLAFLGNEVMGLLRCLFDVFQKRRVIVMVVSYIIIISIMGVLYALAATGPGAPLFFLLVPINIVNLFFLGAFFMAEVNRDENFSGHVNRLLNRLLLRKRPAPER